MFIFDLNNSESCLANIITSHVQITLKAIPTKIAKVVNVISSYTIKKKNNLLRNKLRQTI